MRPTPEVVGTPPYAHLRRGARDGALWLLGFLAAAVFDVVRARVRG